MSAYIVLALTLVDPLQTIIPSIEALKGAGWHLSHEGNITFLIDRTNDYSWQQYNLEAEPETLKLLDRELASGAKVGILLYSNEEVDHQVFVTFTDPLSITMHITADRRVIDIGNGQELTDMGWYIQYLVRPLCTSQLRFQLDSFRWSEVP